MHWKDVWLYFPSRPTQQVFPREIAEKIDTRAKRGMKGESRWRGVPQSRENCQFISLACGPIKSTVAS